MTDATEVAVTRAFVGVSYLLGARGAELAARDRLHPIARQMAGLLESAERLTRARATASAVLAVSRDLDERRVG